ncbi:MAG: RnfABCDGE type electron transport complex subunit D [Firmicutes bacterium]|jgi:Na+-translocating ferredoxin:NAD+ oxidoreductase RnfD subunit|nr:RnfABCDGE type electron transport complex subunit D [Bacillota bacterium]
MTAPKTSHPPAMPAWKRFLKTPKGHVLSALVPLTLFAGLFRQGPVGLLHALVAEATALAVDAFVAWVLRRKVGWSTGGLITGLIIADVLSGITPLYLVSLITAIALGSKHLLKRGRKPIFNPAAVGLLVGIWGFATGQSWWAGLSLLPLWYLPGLLGAGLFVAIRVKKYPQVLTFLGTYFLLLLIMAVLHLGLPSSTPADALRVPFVNSALFLGFFMLTDPPTSPSSARGQIQFGALTALTAVVLFATVGGLSYLLVGLLTANLWTAAATWWHRVNQRTKTPVEGPHHKILAPSTDPGLRGRTSGSG